MNKIIYYRTAKCGSSSIVSAIKKSDHLSIHLKKDSDLSKVFPELNKYQIIIVGHECKMVKNVDPATSWFLKVQNELDKLKNYKSVVVVRDPYSKFISAINYCKISNETLLNIYDNSAKLNFHDHTHILRTQTDAVSYNNRFFADKIIKYENFNKISEFFRENGLEINIPKKNVTKQKKLKLDKQMIEFVNKTYPYDFENFNYVKKYSEYEFGE
mgnify:CR=1 FL=1